MLILGRSIFAPLLTAVLSWRYTKESSLNFDSMLLSMKVSWLPKHCYFPICLFIDGQCRCTGYTLNAVHQMFITDIQNNLSSISSLCRRPFRMTLWPRWMRVHLINAWQTRGCMNSRHVSHLNLGKVPRGEIHAPHSKYMHLTANTCTSQQIHAPHSKYMQLTANTYTSPHESPKPCWSDRS